MTSQIRRPVTQDICSAQFSTVVGKEGSTPWLSVTVSLREEAVHGADVHLRRQQLFLCRSLLLMRAPGITDCLKTQGIPDLWWSLWPHVSLSKNDKPRVHRISASQTWIQQLAPAHSSWVTLGNSLTSLVSGSSSAKLGQQPLPPWVLTRNKGEEAQKEQRAGSGT